MSRVKCNLLYNLQLFWNSTPLDHALEYGFSVGYVGGVVCKVVLPPSLSYQQRQWTGARYACLFLCWLVCKLCCQCMEKTGSWSLPSTCKEKMLMITLTFKNNNEAQILSNQKTLNWYYLNVFLITSETKLRCAFIYKVIYHGEKKKTRLWKVHNFKLSFFSFNRHPDEM